MSTVVDDDTSEALGLRAQVSIYEGDPRSFEDVVKRTTADSKVPGAGDIRVVQESVGAKESTKQMVADSTRVGPSNHVVLKEVVEFKTTTGDALLGAIRGREEAIVMNIGSELQLKDVVAGMRKSLGVGAKAGGGVSQPRVVFFKATKVSSASNALQGLPFHTYILGAPHGIAENAAEHKDFIRPVMLRVDGEYYAVGPDIPLRNDSRNNLEKSIDFGIGWRLSASVGISRQLLTSLEPAAPEPCFRREHPIFIWKVGRPRWLPSRA